MAAQSQLGLQATDGFAIVPDDTNLIIDQADNSQGVDFVNGIYTGSGGTISVVFVGGKQVDFENVPAGIEKPWIVKQVRATGTTATGIKGLISNV